MNRCSICKATGSVHTCALCHVSVHSQCYGPVTAWEDWTCDMCREMAHNLTCVVCPPDFRGLHKSPMRRCGPEQWVHLQCNFHLGVLFVPEVQLDTEDYRVPVKGVEDIDAAAMTIKCTLCCKRVRGLTVHCAEATCSESFHIQCALEKGYQIVDKHKLVCPQHYGATPVPRSAPLPAYMIRTPQTSHSEKRGTSSLQVRPTPRPKESRVEPEPSSPTVLQRAAPEVNCFNVIEEYYSELQYQWLDTSPGPQGRESSAVVESPWTLGLQRTLLTSKQGVALAGFRTEDHIRQLRLSAEEEMVLVEPSVPVREHLGSAVLLDSWRKLSSTEGEEIELLGKCLEVCAGQDEVTRESQFTLELLARSILPTVNFLKQTLRRIAETSAPRLKLTELKETQYQLHVATRWGFIFRNLKAGLKDKTQEAYQKHIHVIEQEEKSVEVNYCDCCVCYNMDEDEYILNPIVMCVGCRVYVHRDCYGIKDAGEEFVCQKCRELAAPRCWICSKGGGALKKDSDRFFHVFCALIDPRIDFKDRLYLNNLKVTARPNGSICSLCGKSEGLLTQCEYCKVPFHYFCAWHQGLLFLPSEAQDSNLRTVSAVRRLQVSVRCAQHCEGRDLAVQQCLRLQPYAYAADRDKVEEVGKSKRLKRKPEKEPEPKPAKLPKTLTTHTVACEERNSTR